MNGQVRFPVIFLFLFLFLFLFSPVILVVEEEMVGCFFFVYLFIHIFFWLLP